MKRVVVGIISRKNKQKEEEYLLVSSIIQVGEFTGYFYLPGGHLHENETDEECLKREIKEEVKLEVINQKKIAESQSDIAGETIIWFDCKVANYDFKINKKEFTNGGFFSQKQMQNMNIWPATKQFFEEYVFK
ncbi:MAG: NUDIX hydrolase [archaeon]|nr:NUDIX hydrolase [archaeon]